MGDRVVIIGTDKTGEISPAAIYLHWGAGDCLDQIVAAGNAGILRDDDLPYAMARLCGWFHSLSPNRTTGLGLVPPPTDLTDDTLKEFSHGDGGVVVLNVTDGTIRCTAGYLAREDEDDDGNVTTRPATFKLSE